METSSGTMNLDLPPGMRRGRNLQVVSERTEQPPQTRNDAARAAALAAKEADLAAALAVVRTAFGILGSRALVILSAIGSAGGFGWAAYKADGWALAAAISFTVMVFLPALWIDRRGG